MCERTLALEIQSGRPCSKFTPTRSNFAPEIPIGYFDTAEDAWASDGVCGRRLDRGVRRGAARDESPRLAEPRRAGCNGVNQSLKEVVPIGTVELTGSQAALLEICGLTRTGRGRDVRDGHAC